MTKAKRLQPDSKANILDVDGDGVITDEELDQAEAIQRFEHEKVQFDNEDKKQDAQRNMAWFALAGMLLYPFAVVLAILAGLDKAGELLSDMAATYFVSVAAIVAAFYAKEALGRNDKPKP
tara:strand:- start:79 stop:441 length:363 start_codon:yes stop_codon:yes gene_type:complete